MTTCWDKEQAELLRRIALAGGSCAADECQGAALDALIKVGFVTVRARRSRRPYGCRIGPRSGVAPRQSLAYSAASFTLVNEPKPVMIRKVPPSSSSTGCRDPLPDLGSALNHVLKQKRPCRQVISTFKAPGDPQTGKARPRITPSGGPF